MPHMMRRVFYFVVLVLTAVSLSSCLKSEDRATPLIKAGYITRVSAAGVCDTITFADTLHLYDTLQAPLLLYGVYNNLTTFRVSADTSVVSYRLVTYDSYQHLLDKGSAPEAGYLQFVSGCVLYETGLQYIPKKTGDYQVRLVLASDAGDKYSPAEGYFTICVR